MVERILRETCEECENCSQESFRLQLEATIIEIEGVINSRPLTYVYNE
ncbi:hypothetical protein NPIL_158511, partial [Nephila pilipes]